MPTIPDERVGLGLLVGKVARASRSGVIAGGRWVKLLADPDQGVIVDHGLFLYGWSGPGRMDGGWPPYIHRAAADQPPTIPPSGLRRWLDGSLGRLKNDLANHPTISRSPIHAFDGATRPRGLEGSPAGLPTAVWH